MTARQIKTLGECRQWHLEQYKMALALSKHRDKVIKAHWGFRSKKHKRFADAIEKCLPRPF